MKILKFKSLLLWILFFYISNFSANDKYNKAILIKCQEVTGTGKSDIFKINKPNFKWYYKGKWYELSNSNEGVAKDWKVSFSKNKIIFYNYKTKWHRLIDLEKMTALMKFSTGEEYIYNCSYLDM